ncbi:MAG: cysteine--tRNA ligase [Parcubacteria group bacterium]|nr:cysteine--tRNA ligase [Parcubacteria group bacterium]
MLKLFNTLTRKIEIFRPIKQGKVGIYSCGPTVYDFAHIGNLRAYIFVDLLKRYLIYSGFKVKHVMNITDVDDKTIKNSQQNNKSLQEFTDFYSKAFIKDIKSLNIKMPDIMPRATKHIPEMVDLIKKIGKHGYSYKSEKSIYFKISKFSDYGKLAQLDKQTLKQNAAGRLNISDEYEKEQVNDFVLWKAWQPEDGEVFWDTEIGKGRPGWHIECSAMSTKYLGEIFDIHTGGVDLIFPHHTNEIAQSEAAFKKKFVNYWLHNEHLLVEGKKMSKSLGNFYALKDIKDKKYNLLLMRLILLKTHYRKVLNFTLKDLDEAKSIAEKFLSFLAGLDFVVCGGSNNLDIKNMISQSRKEFKKAMDNDLNISSGLASLFDFIEEVYKRKSLISTNQAQEIKNYIFEIDEVLGFIRPLYEQYQMRLNKKLATKKILNMISKREKARKNKDYKEADKIRIDLLEKGIVIEDTEKGDKARLLKIID